MEDALIVLLREELLVADKSDNCSVARKIINDRRASLYPRTGGLVRYFIPVDGQSLLEVFEALNMYLYQNIIEFTRCDMFKTERIIILNTTANNINAIFCIFIER